MKKYPGVKCHVYRADSVKWHARFDAERRAGRNIGKTIVLRGTVQQQNTHMALIRLEEKDWQGEIWTIHTDFPAGHKVLAAVRPEIIHSSIAQPSSAATPGSFQNPRPA